MSRACHTGLAGDAPPFPFWSYQTHLMGQGENYVKDSCFICMAFL